MRMVIDSNMLRSEELRRYLSRSSNNYAVLTDYASMEAYKGDTLVSIYKSMSVVADFPKQVIILKGTQAICGLSGRSAGLQRRMIDELQTSDFHTYCKHLASAKRGHTGLQRQLLDLGREATAHMDRMLIDAGGTGSAIEGIAMLYTAEERRVLREGAPYTDEMFRKLLAGVSQIARQLFENHPQVRKWPSIQNLPNTFIFRAALCGYLLALEWISVGGAKGARPERLRNDLVDINFAAYATYFDGLMSADKRVVRIYEYADVLVQMILDFNRRLQQDAS